MKKLFQPYYLVTESPWPLFMSISLMSLFFSLINWFYKMNFYMFILSSLMLLMFMFQWWRDVIRESTYQGFHTMQIVKGLKLGMILFIISELFFFISIFWCYLHASMSPNIELSYYWPPKNVIMFNPYYIPLLNTIILLSSGITITWCHYSILMGKKLLSMISLLITISLGLIFTLIQYKEYYLANFSIADSIFGSIFYLSTGFHGLHVLIGTLFLLINLIRMMKNNFSLIHHLGFEMSAWYWHFVDIVWLFLYLLIYIWSY